MKFNLSTPLELTLLDRSLVYLSDPNPITNDNKSTITLLTNMTSLSLLAGRTVQGVNSLIIIYCLSKNTIVEIFTPSVFSYVLFLYLSK